MKLISDKDSWCEILSRIGHFDFYHSYDYHQLNCRSYEDKPLLFAQECGGVTVAVPLIIRPIDAIGSDAIQYYDATSVYGYCGPVTSTGIKAETAVMEFQIALRDQLPRIGVISVFSRLHPVLRNDHMVRSLGELFLCGSTISIDLNRSEEEQIRQYSSNHRRGIRKLVKSGVTCFLSGSEEDLCQFIDIYHQSMQRVGATREYFFDRDYFARLIRSGDYEMHLFVCRMDGQVIAGGLFSSCCGIVQYHLGGTATKSLGLAPSKLMFDTVRRWAIQSGHTVFHLGGGVGGDNDSLYSFKKGFSKIEHPFLLWQWILNKNVYDELTEQHRAGMAQRGRETKDQRFFPAYRAPAKE